jgi:uncharacterized protein YbjT (DUF2867 family)
MSSSPNKKVIVVGASGYIGKATLAALVSRHGSTVDIYAGVRDPSKFGTMDGVTVVAADMGDKAGLATALEGFDSVYLVIPGHEQRTTLGLSGLEAAQDAGVKFVLLLSVLTADDTNTIFGRQFLPLEQKVKELGIAYAIVRLPVFIDNNYAHAGSIKDPNQSTFYDPTNPTKPFTPVNVSDAGKAGADILAQPADLHNGKTYKLVMPAFTLNDLAAAFTKSLGKTVTATTVPYPACKEAFMGMGFPEWQTDGILELFQLIDAESPLTNEADTGDFTKITGEPPMTVEEWVEQNAAGFK